MPLLRCRNCQVEITAESNDCPRCQCHYPFICAECGEATGMVSAIGWTYPFNKAGEPLCPKHARQLCEKCRKPFPPEELVKRTERWDYIQSTGEYIAVPGAFCPACNHNFVEPAKPTGKKRAGCLGVLLFITLTAVAVPLLVFAQIFYRR